MFAHLAGWPFPIALLPLPLLRYPLLHGRQRRLASAAALVH